MTAQQAALYFVVATKHSLFTDGIRDKEICKIKCGQAHFTELANRNTPSRAVYQEMWDKEMWEVWDMHVPFRSSRVE